jgi:aspartokinase-like uncharacterized kinase
MNFQAVLKVGGSLSRTTALPALCQAIGRLAASYPFLVVPGGGEFADQVRLAYHRFHLGETAAHNMALLAMDQYGYLLNELVPNSVLVTELLQASRRAEAGQTPVLLPAAVLRQADPLPHSWEVTSDTIAAWLAHISGCPQLILLKDVDGLYSAWDSSDDAGNLIVSCTAADLGPHLGGVDESFARYLISTPLETWVINGTQPARLSELLATGRTLGTHIRPFIPPSEEAV